MRKLGMVLGGVALLVAAAYGAYWYQVKGKVDALVAQLAPFAEVQYGAIHAHPDGTVGVNGLTVSPRQLHAPITVEQVRVRLGSPLYLLFGTDQPPRELYLSLQGVEQSLESAFFHQLQQQMDLAREADPLYVSPTALGCGAIRQFDVNSLRMMGYRDLRMNIDLHYRGDEAARKIRLDALVDIEQTGDTRLEMVFSADPSQLDNPVLASGNARLDKLVIDYHDRGYNQRQAAFCAREAELRPADYQARHVELFRRWLVENGIELPPEWINAYAELQQEGVSVQLALNPLGGFGSAELMMMQDPVYAVEKLNPSLRINDRALALDGIRWDELALRLAQAGSGSRIARDSEAAPAAASEPSAEVVETPVAPAPAAAVAAPASAPAVKRFRETPLDQLAEHVGAQVRIFTYFGNDVEGRLVAVDRQGVRVLQRLARGVAEYPLEYTRIQQVEVYR